MKINTVKKKVMIPGGHHVALKGARENNGNQKGGDETMTDT